MLKVGITGSFGSGKSTVAAMFARRGARVIDADRLGHILLKKDRGCQRQVGRLFGAELMTSGSVDRSRLGKIVFSDPAALEKLEKILHPRMGRMIREEIRKESRKDRIVILDAALLIEAGWHRLMDVVIVVRTRRDLQLKRVMARTGLSRADVLRRIRRQMLLGEKIKYAAYVIDNSGPSATTEQCVERIFRSLLSFVHERTGSRQNLATYPSNRRES